MRLPFYSRIVSTAIVLPLWFAVPPVSADDNPQVAIETRLVSATDTYAQQLGIKLGFVSPTGEFGDKAGAGFGFGISAREQITPRLAVGFHGGWSMFGTKDLTAQGLGEPKVVVTEVGPEIELLIKESARTGGAGQRILDDLTMSFLSGVSVGSLGVTQDFGASGYPKAKSAETQPVLYAGPQVMIPVREVGTVLLRGQYSHIFTGDGGEDWISFWAGYLHQLNPTNYDQFRHRNTAWNGTGLLGPLTTLSVRTICGMPINDFHDIAIPGLGVGVNGTFTITDAMSGVVGASYQTYGTPGFQEEANDRELKSYEFDAGVQFDVRIPKSNTDTYVQLTINPVLLDYKDFPTPSEILSDNGVFFSAGAGVRRAITDQVSVGVLSDIPVVGFLFDNKPSKRVRTELFVTLTPRVIKGI